MPSLKRPDGASIHWEARGDGPPLYVFHNAMVSQPSTFSALLDDLARDHRVVTFDGRGTGASTRHDTYDLATDVEDASALVDEVGSGGVAIALGFQPAPLALVAALPPGLRGGGPLWRAATGASGRG